MRKINYSYPNKFSQDRKFPTIEARITINNPQKILIVVFSLDDVHGVEKMTKEQINSTIDDFKNNIKDIPYLLNMKDGLYNIDYKNFVAVEFNYIPIFK